MRYRLLVLLAVWTPLAASAQTPRQREVQVTAIAGADVYLDAGREDGLATGDTLRVGREGVEVGRLVVRSAAASRSVAGFADAPFPVTRGQRLTVSWTSRPPDDSEPPPSLPPPEPGRVSVFDRPRAEALAPASAQPRLTGRVQVGTSGWWSDTRTATGGGTTRASATPFAAVTARATDLPGGLRARLDGRLTYRYRDGVPFERPHDLRLYRASAGGTWRLVEIEAGRLLDPHDRFSGALDGLRLHVGAADRGVALTAGLQPDWGAGAFSTDLPRITASGHTRFGVSGAGAAVSALAGHVSPTRDGVDARTYVGGEGRVAGEAFTLSVDALLDRDPAARTWDFSRLNLYGAWTAVPGLHLHGRYGRSRPYLLVGSLQVMRPASERIGGGAAYTFPGSPLVAPTVRADIAVARREGFQSVSYSGGVRAPRLPVGGVTLDAYGSLWTGRGGPVGSARVALSRSFGSAWASGGYRFSHSAQPGRAVTLHGLEGTLQVPLADRLSLTVQVGADASGQLASTHLYTALWWKL